MFLLRLFDECMRKERCGGDFMGEGGKVFFEWRKLEGRKI